VRKKEFEWEVIRLRARGEYLGRIRAVDEEAAIKAAITAFAIADPERQKQLLVRRRA
jgi:hypothetical protein